MLKHLDDAGLLELKLEEGKYLIASTGEPVNPTSLGIAVIEVAYPDIILEMANAYRACNFFKRTDAKERSVQYAVFEYLQI